MIAVYVVFFILAIIVFFCLTGIGIIHKILLSALVFLVPAIAFTIWLVKVGDRAPDDAITVPPEKSLEDNFFNSK